MIDFQREKKFAYKIKIHTFAALKKRRWFKL